MNWDEVGAIGQGLGAGSGYSSRWRICQSRRAMQDQSRGRMACAPQPPRLRQPRLRYSGASGDAFRLTRAASAASLHSYGSFSVVQKSGH